MSSSWRAIRAATRRSTVFGVGADLAAGDGGAGVVLGLEQAGDELGLVGVDGGGFGFQADVGAAAQDVGVAGPPAAAAGFAGELDEGLAGGLVGDAVGVEQVGDVAGVDAGLAVFDPAELGG